MKNQFKILLTLFTGMVVFADVDAQWNQTTGNYTTGSLGIGMSVIPGDKLKVIATGTQRSTGMFGATGSGVAGIYFDASNGDFSGSDYGSLLQNDDLSISLSNSGAYPLYFKTSNSNRMTILGNGNVGIGTTSPSSLLHVNEGNIFATRSSGDAQIRVDNSANTEGTDAIFFADVGGSAAGDPYSLYRIAGSYQWSVGVDNSDGNKFKISGSGSSVPGIGDKLTIATSGNVGIGTTSPSAKLDVYDTPELDGSDHVSLRVSSSRTSSSWIPGADISGIDFYSKDGSGTGAGVKTAIRMFTKDAIASGYGLKFLVDSGTSFNEALRINSSGNVGIGTTDPGSFKLAVEGKIGAREVKVTMEDPWPDYVFSKYYELKSLKETELYIKENQHLPEMPSAEEVAENGIELGEMNAKLLQKIEELTLHLIEQNNRLESQQKRIEELESIVSK